VSDITRRQWLAGTAALATAGATPAAEGKKKPFGFMLNTATIMGQKLSLIDQVETAARAGYDAIEPWIRGLEAHVKTGHSLKDVAKRCKDLGLRVESAIGFAPWIVNDESARKKGLEQMKRDMELVQQMGGVRIAAPPAGATEVRDLDLRAAADRYRVLCEVGDKLGITAQVELWGFSRTLGRLGETAMVAIECGHPRACILADVFHLYKGGSGFTGMKQLGPVSLQVLHMNDYPADPPRERITDAHRVYPGDGSAPLTALLRDLHAIGFRGFLSLEVFNREYWKQDALAVSKTGLAKMKAVVDKALAS
jgi:sugar phosphate isomerase/epimerase